MWIIAIIFIPLVVIALTSLLSEVYESQGSGERVEVHKTAR
jgi:hypothetical protein